MKVLSTVKVTDKGRIALPKNVRMALHATIGDHVQIFQDDLGRICIAKVTPPEEA